MMEYLGTEPMGSDGKHFLSLVKVSEGDKIRYMLLINNPKTTEILVYSGLNKEHLKLFKKLINDANLEGLKI